MQNHFFKIAVSFAVVIILSGVFVFSFYQKKTENRELVLKYISIWESELSKSLLQQQNLVFLNKISEQVREFGVEMIQVDFAIDRLQHLQNSEEMQKIKSSVVCQDSFQTLITLYGLPTANIKFCQSRSYLIQAALFSPYVILVLLATILLPLIWAQLSLSRYRQTLLSLMTTFQNWSEVDYQDLITLKNQNARMNETDVLSQKIIQFVQSGLRLRTQLIASQQVSQISRQVAHDIRSPLTALNMLIVSVPELPESKVGLLKMATEKIQAITDDLMLKSKQELIEKNKTLTNITTLIQNIIQQKQIEAPRVHFQSELQDVQASLDPHGLSRVLSNVINNGIEAMQNLNESKLILRLIKQDSKLQIQIQDFGSGISPEIQSQLFLEGSTFGKANGTGMGLFHAKQWVEQSGGVIRIESQKGQGTSVFIELPFVH